jgi:ABC-type transport system involved in cytochrome bd biosynthesis fused ATPase/permease subunit
MAVPQLEANHIFADTLAFNLLVGCGWPPTPADLAQAEALCRELGLGGLLDRLPAGLDQRVGEAGWRLSDGEASRVCLARGLPSSFCGTLSELIFCRRTLTGPSSGPCGSSSAMTLT